MSTGQQRALIGLALLALLFVAVLVWGLASPACTDCDKDNYRPGRAMKAMGRVFTLGREPVLKPARHPIAREAELRLALPTWEGNLRTLKLRRLRGEVALRLDMAHPSEKLEDQAEFTTLPRKAKDPADNDSLSFAVNGRGGWLVGRCGQGACEIEVE